MPKLRTRAILALTAPLLMTAAICVAQQPKTFNLTGDYWGTPILPS